VVVIKVSTAALLGDFGGKASVVPLARFRHQLHVQPIVLQCKQCVMGCSTFDLNEGGTDANTARMWMLQLYELAASGVRERAKLRQELNEMQAEMQASMKKQQQGKQHSACC